MDEEIISVRALPCNCRGRCFHGNSDMRRCPCYIARLTKKTMIMTYCRFCRRLTWHIGGSCVKCKQRAEQNI